MNNEEKILAMLESMQTEIVDIKQQVESHTRSILKLENSVMHELKLLRENLPDVIVRHEALKELETSVERHDVRLSVLEMQAASR